LKGHLAEMMARHAQPGRLDWIGLRGERYGVMRVVNAAIVTDAGLAGDHASAGKKAVTLMQAEHLPVIAQLAGRDSVAQIG
jgi:MOSC domain-containing protein YiiM